MAAYPHVWLWLLFRYGIGFAGLMATLTHVALYHGKEIRDQWRAAIEMKDHDIHSRMMMKYNEVPQW